MRRRLLGVKILARSTSATGLARQAAIADTGGFGAEIVENFGVVEATDVLESCLGGLQLANRGDGDRGLFGCSCRIYPTGASTTCRRLIGALR